MFFFRQWRTHNNQQFTAWISTRITPFRLKLRYHYWTMSALQDLGIDPSIVTRRTDDFLSSPVVTCFLPMLRQIGMTSISSFSNMIKMDRRAQNVLALNDKLNFLFTPIMVNGTTVSLLNKCAETEFMTCKTTGELQFNHNFWKANVETKPLVSTIAIFNLTLSTPQSRIAGKIKSRL